MLSKSIKALKEVNTINTSDNDIINELRVKTREYYKISNLIYEKYIASISQYDHIKQLAEHSKTQDDQRTAAWLNKREGLITASDIPAVLGRNKYRNRKQTLEVKSKPYERWSNIFTRWGNKWEEVATQMYEYIFDVKVEEACLMVHPVYQFIGASCDGFVLDHKNKEAWCLEIKCPYRRNPTEDIPECYVDQLKTQMEVCKINKGVFWDVKLREYKTIEEFNADNKHKYKGMIYKYWDKSKTNENGYWIEHFVYPPIGSPKEQEEYIVKNVPDILAKKDSYVPGGYCYWRVEDIKMNIIYRELEWIEGNIGTIEDFWLEMSEMRENNKIL